MARLGADARGPAILTSALPDAQTRGRRAEGGGTAFALLQRLYWVAPLARAILVLSQPTCERTEGFSTAEQSRGHLRGFILVHRTFDVGQLLIKATVLVFASPLRPESRSDIAMLDDPVRSVMRRRNLLTAMPAISVAQAARRMAKRNVGAIVMIENERLVGIFTERDIVFRVVARGLDPVQTRVADVMTRSPVTIDAAQRFGHALLIMHDNGFRHLPVTENGKLVGIVSARSALDPELEDFVSEAQRRKHLHRTRERLHQVK